MRIFNTGVELLAAMALPDSDPSAFCFKPVHFPAGFVCCDCGTVRMFDAGGFTTGYARADGNQLLCYACADARQRAALVDRTKPAYGYVSGDGKHFTTWTGGTLGTVQAYGESRAGWNGGTIARFRVRDVHGAWWSGRGAGRGMACTLRPMKAPA